MQNPFQGIYPALPTPFRDGRLDLDSFEGLVELHAERRTEGLVVCGTTGESATLNDYERRSLIHAAVELTHGRMPVIAGVGTNCTRTTLELARFAAAAGVDGLLVVTPYYNKPSPKGLLLHFGQVADAVELPVVLYNVPSRTGVDLGPDVATELRRRHPNVVAVKEASTRLERVRELVAGGLAVLCGEDSHFAPFVAHGASGTISVAANLVPDELAELQEAVLSGETGLAAELAERLAPLVRALFVEVNPVPLKAAMSRLGLCRPDVRPPLAPLEPASVRAVDEALGTLLPRAVSAEPV